MKQLSSPLALWVILAASVLQQMLGHLNGDVSWLITACERLLEGGIAYVDVLETNPPAAWLIYMPAVWLARLWGVAPEAVVAGAMFLFGLVVLHLCKALLPFDGEKCQVFLNGLAALIFFMPGFSFAEREHVAVMAALPIICLWSLPSSSKITWSLRFVSACPAALTIIIKPHFALVIGLPLLWRAFVMRRWHMLFGFEPLLIAALVLCYVAFIIFRYPAFFDVMPALVETYVPIRAPLKEVLTGGWFLAHLGLAALILWSLWRKSVPLLVVQLLLGSFGFQIAYLLQMKGWTNHGLPGVTLVAASALVVALPYWERWRALDSDEIAKRVVTMGVLPVGFYLMILFGAGLQFTGFEPHEGLARAIRQIHPQAPRLMSLTGALDVGHPATRAAGGKWVARPHSTWMAVYARILLYLHAREAAHRARLLAYIERDVAIFVEDVERQRPDLILIDEDGYTEELMLHPAIRAVLQPYEPRGYAAGITIWGRSDQRG